tara:strand:- start:22 stop:384 length:363 start_codon:yes stop_codon:yes gene_type:complete
MANRKFKMIVPKPAAIDDLGMEVKLFTVDEIVEADSDVMKANMETFISNGWAMEVKIDSVDEKVEIPAEVKRARNEKGHLVGDDKSTPDVNEAWEGGEAPKKKTTAKKKTTKKTTKKASS